MSRPPASVLVAGVLFLASAVYGLVRGTLGLELFAYEVPRAVVVIAAVIHVYLGLGLWAGDAFARVLALWTLGAGFLGSWAAMFRQVAGHTASFDGIAPHVVNLFVTAFFVWHLSGSAALGYAGGAHAHHE
jgi:hypothetical protein